MQFTIKTLVINEKKLTLSLVKQLPDGYHRNSKSQELLPGVTLLGWVKGGKSNVRERLSKEWAAELWVLFAKDGKVYHGVATKEDQEASEQIFV